MKGIHHATFTIERTFGTTPVRAFRYWSDEALKERWTACHPDWSVIEAAFDFRAGGIEARRWRTSDGSEQTFTAHYLDIVAPERIVYAFEMSLAGRRISASLATVALDPAGGRTRMAYTEQIAFFGGRDALAARIAGTGGGFDRLVEAIAERSGANA
jgi:uncharacterized protein YndB with AHSA1/START domain